MMVKNLRARFVSKQQLIDAELERVRQRLSRQAVLLRSGLSSARTGALLEAEGLGVQLPAGKNRGVSGSGELNTADCQLVGGGRNGIFGFQKRHKGSCSRSVKTAEVAEVWGAVSAMQAVAYYAGAPLAWGCDSLAAALSELLLLRKRRRVLLAAPKSSVLIIASLPLLAIGLGQLLGFNPLAVLVTPLGWLLLGIGAFFLVCGLLWIHKLIRAAENAEQLTGFECELLVLALRGGLSLIKAKKLVADKICESGSAWLNTDELADSGAAGTVSNLMQSTGTGAAQLLLETAAKKRRIAAENLETGAEKLGSRVLLPLGVCILPAFVVLGVIPVVVSMFQGW